VRWVERLGFQRWEKLLNLFAVPLTQGCSSETALSGVLEVFRHALGPDAGENGAFAAPLSLLVRLAKCMKVILSPR